MKVLLTAVNAKYIHSNLAVYDLRAYAETYGTGGAQVEIAEYTINHTIDYILEGIYKAKPDVLCFSCYIWNLDYVEQLMDEYHKICPEVPIWVGGPEVSYETEAFLKEHPQVTGVMVGEGEETFLELCESYAKAGIGEMAEKMNLLGNQGNHVPCRREPCKTRSARAAGFKPDSVLLWRRRRFSEPHHLL